MQILDKKHFQNYFFHLTTNFSFKYTAELISLIYQDLSSKLTDRMFKEKCLFYIKTIKKEEIVAKYGFSGQPAVADWLDYFMPKKTKKIGTEQIGSTIYPIFDYEDNYKIEIQQAKKNLNINSQQLESEETILNKKNIQTYIGALNTNLKSK
jgi:hypothetical protein